MQVSDNKKTALLLTGLLVLLLGGTFLLDRSGGVENASYKTAAEEVVALCEDEAYRPACYDEEIPKLMDQGYSMEEAFTVTREVQRLDRGYAYCHVLGHHLSAKETAKDPSKWKDVIIRAPSGICSNGAIHGAFQERFRKESLSPHEIEAVKDELSGICEPREGWSPTPLEQATCTHALGHLTMYIADAEINEAVSLCDEIAINTPERDMRQLCYDGAFMQIFQPLEPDDFALIEGKEIESKDEAELFCGQFEGVVRSSCVSESWPLYSDAIEDPRRAGELCTQLSDDPGQMKRCFNAVFYVLTAQSGLDSAWVEQYCPHVDPSLRGQCFANAASRMIEVDWENIDDALDICTLADKYGVSDICYDELLMYSSYNFKIDSPAFNTLCAGLPGRWGEQCAAESGRQ